MERRLQRLRDSAIAQGKEPRPPAPSEQRLLDAQPTLHPVDSIVLACESDLDSCRPAEQHTVKGAPITIHGAIPWPAIEAWARTHGLGLAELHVLAEVIRIRDVARAERITSELRSKT